jgi:hypothetical protein
MKNAQKDIGITKKCDSVPHVTTLVTLVTKMVSQVPVTLVSNYSYTKDTVWIVQKDTTEALPTEIVTNVTLLVPPVLPTIVVIPVHSLSSN